MTLDLGDYAYDKKQCQVGEVVGVAHGYLWLRPLDGKGHDWLVSQRHVRRATTAEELLAKVRVYNERNGR